MEKLRIQLALFIWHDEPFVFVSSCLEQGQGEKGREERDGTEDTLKRAMNWCGTAGGVGEYLPAAFCMLPDWHPALKGIRFSLLLQRDAGSVLESRDFPLRMSRLCLSELRQHPQSIPEQGIALDPRG